MEAKTDDFHWVVTIYCVIRYQKFCFMIAWPVNIDEKIAKECKNLLSLLLEFEISDAASGHFVAIAIATVVRHIFFL